MLHRRRRSGPASTSTLAIAPSLAPVQTPVFALVLTSPINSEIARRSSAEGYPLFAATAISNLAEPGPTRPCRAPRRAASPVLATSTFRFLVQVQPFVLVCPPEGRS